MQVKHNDKALRIHGDRLLMASRPGFVVVRWIYDVPRHSLSQRCRRRICCCPCLPCFAYIFATCFWWLVDDALGEGAASEWVRSDESDNSASTGKALGAIGR